MILDEQDNPVLLGSRVLINDKIECVLELKNIKSKSKMVFVPVADELTLIESHFITLKEARKMKLDLLPARAQLPVGTRIRFLKTLVSGPDEDGPGNHYATKGELGTIGESPYGPPREGHWVFWDRWPSAQFGAKLGEDFEIYPQK